MKHRDGERESYYCNYTNWCYNGESMTAGHKIKSCIKACFISGQNNRAGQVWTKYYVIKYSSGGGGGVHWLTVVVVTGSPLTPAGCRSLPSSFHLERQPWWLPCHFLLSLPFPPPWQSDTLHIHHHFVPYVVIWLTWTMLHNNSQSHIIRQF